MIDITFERKVVNEGRQVILSTRHGSVYVQYSYIKTNEEPYWLEEEIKKLLTSSIMTQMELDRFNAYRSTLIFRMQIQCEEGSGCQYTLVAVNSPVAFNTYSFHTHEGQAQEEIDARINEAKNIMTYVILRRLNEANNNSNVY